MTTTTKSIKKSEENKSQNINLEDVLSKLNSLTEELLAMKKESLEKDKEIDRLKKEKNEKPIEDEWITVIR